MHDQQPDQARDGRSAGRLLARALLRRCPNCGARQIFRTYFEQHDVCPGCAMRLDRGEKDFFIGAYTINLIVAELLVFFGGLGRRHGSCGSRWTSSSGRRNPATTQSPAAKDASMSAREPSEAHRQPDTAICKQDFHMPASA